MSPLVNVFVWSSNYKPHNADVCCTCGYSVLIDTFKKGYCDLLQYAINQHAVPTVTAEVTCADLEVYQILPVVCI